MTRVLLRRIAFVVAIISATVGVMSSVPAYAAAGDLDTNFSGDGQLTIFLGGATANDVVVQPDRKLVLVGTAVTSECASVSSGQFGVARLNANGTLDQTFSGDGKRTVKVGSNCSERAIAGATQPDGKIVVAGQANDFFAVVRFNANGSLDKTFSRDGKRVLLPGNQSLFGSATGVAIQEDGKIVVAGGGYSNDDIAIVRLTPNGAFDKTFGDGRGYVTTDIADADDRTRAVAIQPDGKILVAGEGGGHGNGNEFFVARYDTSGNLDAGFADGGIFTRFIGAYIGTGATDLALQKDGKIVVAGTGNFDETSKDFTVLRLSTTGQLDETFSEDGIVNTGFAGTSWDYANAVVIQNDGKIVIGGTTDSTPDPHYVFALARYTPSGDLDPTFGTGGVVTTTMPRQSVIYDLAIQPRARIVAAGFTYPGPRMAVARYLTA